ncbi:MAG TPA: hypothetical protein VF767_05295 [Bryobacteraceae bacterium]
MLSYPVPKMSDQPESLRRERIADALREFERRIEHRLLPASPSECWDLLLNRAPNRGRDCPNPPATRLPLRYETHDGVPLLRVIDPDAENHACPGCELFGRSHCCGGLIFLHYALREAGVPHPLDWLAVELEPGLYLPDWEQMLDNERLIVLALRAFFEANRDRVSGEPD